MAVLAALSAVAYFASSHVGYALAIPHGTLTLWPPSGLILGLLLLSARRDWPAIVAGAWIGSVASGISTGQTVGFAIAAGLANEIESLAAALLVTHRLKRRVDLSSLRSVLEISIGAAVVVNALTAVLGALVMNHWFHRPLGTAWLVWWVGDGLGILIVTPIVLAWRGSEHWWRSRSRAAYVEGAVLLAGLAIVAQLTLGTRDIEAFKTLPYAAFPLLFWAALRFGPPGAATASLVLAGIATWNAALGLGPFVSTTSSGLKTATDLYLYLGVASVSSLITAVMLEERRGANELLVESEARYRSVVEAATDAIVTIGDDSRIVFANTAVERIFGYLPRELIGQPLTMLMPAAFHQSHKQGLAQYIATGFKRIQWRATALPGLHRSGQEIPLEVSFGELSANGRRLFTGIIRDISEKRATEQALYTAEERMRFALDAANVGVWDANLGTGVSHCSETSERMHGLAPGCFPKTLQAFLALVHVDDREAIGERIDRALLTCAQAASDYRVVLPDGAVRTIRAIMNFSYDEHGAAVRAAGITVDVTEQRELEAQYRQSQKMEAVGQLAGGIAHDFNNILTAIGGYTTLVLDELSPDSPQREDLGEVLKAANRAGSLTRQLLAFSRRDILEARIIDLSASLRHIEPMLRRLIREDIELVVRAPAPGYVRADPSQIEQVILNLAINARDAMPDGGTLALEVANLEADAGGDNQADAGTQPRVRLVVRDTGIGMDAATASRIFEPFFTTKALGQGTGLGLATVHGIIRQSGGTVSVQSTVGRGTTFTVHLPRASDDIPSAAPATMSTNGRRAPGILLVEDDAALRKLVCRLLETNGYTVWAAATPSEALVTVADSSRHIDALLTDVVLPEMNGSRARGRDPRSPAWHPGAVHVGLHRR